MNTVRDLLLSSVNEFADSIAVIEEDKRISYKDLGSLVDNFSIYLSSKGIKKGDAVIILLPNSIELVVAFLAVANIGAISVPVNTSFKKEEIRYYVEHSLAKLILTEETLEELAKEIVAGTDTLVEIVKPDSDDWRANNSAAEPVSIEPSDEVIYLYSTGSTGKPKRVSRTHLNLVALADNHTQTVGWTHSDKVLFTVPISHTYGFGNFISSIKIGAAVVVMGEFNRNRVLDILEEESITVFPAVPVMLDVLARTYQPQAKDLSMLKLVLSAGAPLAEKTFHDFHESYGIYPRQLYGSSETGVISINLGEDIEQTFNSVGRAVKNVTVKIFNEDSNELELDQVGEIAVKSPSMTTTGYYGLPKETKEVFRGGYYYTGDLGRIDQDGFIYIVGRKKLFINISGNKVDPVEVENVLLEFDKVTEAAVLGILDSEGSESVKAVIVSSEGVEKKDILNFCKQRISNYKIPSIIEFRDELPRSPTGKVLREELK